ncbi:MAG TPA: 1,4-alpha-glucan branching protein GlgB [bacterium]
MAKPGKPPAPDTPPRKPPRRASRAPGAPDAAPPLPADAVAHLLSLEHGDPHTLLGLHPAGAGRPGWVVRAFRPDAASMRLHVAGEPPRAMERVHEGGLHQVWLREATGRFRYRLEAIWPSGDAETYDDPYGFWPTLGELDLHLFAEGRHEHIYDKLGAHPLEVDGTAGVAFALWAPNARGVSVVGDFNYWDGRRHPMRRLGGSGVWELFVPGLAPGARYKFELRGAFGRLFVKADPYANATEVPPATASVINRSTHHWLDGDWMERRARQDVLREPLSIYEVHLGSWRRKGDHGEQPLTYRELAEPLAHHMRELGFTHVELLPITEHPYGPSWGYQVGSYFAPTARYGTPDDLRSLVDHLHGQGIGVILDWVPAHFPKDEFALGRFDGTALYEHLDPRRGEHPDWHTYIFNYGRNEVRNFLLGSALYWLESFHLDGLRLDAVASLLYLDYSRKEGEWMANPHGGRENLDAIGFLKQLNEVAHARHPGVLMIAEESTAWPGVSRPTYAGGLGFGFKWNMGWMHDTLLYFSKEPVHRRWHHNNLTFGLLYAWSENFILPFSHDEVVHGKGSLLDKMPGDRWQKFANLRALYGYMWAHPGRKLLFMGCEFGQWREWNHANSLDWHLLAEADHRGLQALVQDLNRRYRDEPALYAAESDPASFRWIDAQDAESNVISFRRIVPGQGRELVCVCNLSPVPRQGYRVGLPRAGRWDEVLNTDAARFGGSGLGNLGAIKAVDVPWHGLPCSAEVTLPPLATVWFRSPSEA